MLCHKSRLGNSRKAGSFGSVSGDRSVLLSGASTVVTQLSVRRQRAQKGRAGRGGCKKRQCSACSTLFLPSRTPAHGMVTPSWCCLPTTARLIYKSPRRQTKGWWVSWMTQSLWADSMSHRFSVAVYKTSMHQLARRAVGSPRWQDFTNQRFSRILPFPSQEQQDSQQSQVSTHKPMSIP